MPSSLNTLIFQLAFTGTWEACEAGIVSSFLEEDEDTEFPLSSSAFQGFSYSSAGVHVPLISTHLQL